MKYEEMEIVFIQCDKLDPSNKHDDNDCKNCVDIYENMKDDLIDEFNFQNKDKQGFSKRGIIDFCEISQDNFDGEHLKFSIWSEPL